MSYLHNLSLALITPSMEYVDTNWISNPQASCFQKQVLARGALFLFAPASVIVNALDIIIGLGAALAAACTLGMWPNMNQFAFKHLYSLRNIVPQLYLGILGTVNPQAEIALPFKKSVLKKSVIGKCLIYISTTFKSLKQTSKTHARSKDSFLKKQITSRLSYALSAVVATIGAVAGGIIGISLAVLSIGSAGYFKSLNSSVMFFTASSASTLILYSAIKFLNPQAKVSLYKPGFSWQF